MNKHIGCDELGVKGSHEKISFGGELIRDFIASGDYICLNNSHKASGGPFTRFDPSNPEKKENMSCLSLVIVSKKLEPFIEKLEIDYNKTFSPIRALSKTKSVTSDHFPLIVTFAANFCTNISVKKPDCFTMWNTNKEGGWEKFKELTEDDDKFDKAFENEDTNDEIALTTSETMNKIEKIMNTVQYTAFGKVKRKRINKVPSIKEVDENNLENKDELLNQKLLQSQRKEIEEELKQLENLKVTKGKTAAVFNLFNKIRGQKKEGAEMLAMKDPESGELVFDPEDLKTTSLNYCVNLLQNTFIDPEYEKEIYIDNLLH